MRSGLRWLWIAVVVFFLDLVSKHAALTNLIDYQPLEITSFFNLTLSYNTGAAFSFLHRASGWQTWLFGLLAISVTVGIIIWMNRLSNKQRWLNIALSLIIGGALGNLFDRIYYGHVIDFIQLHAAQLYWPIFNVADSAICVGAIMLFIDTLRSRKKAL